MTIVLSLANKVISALYFNFLVKRTYSRCIFLELVLHFPLPLSYYVAIVFPVIRDNVSMPTPINLLNEIHKKVFLTDLFLLNLVRKRHA